MSVYERKYHYSLNGSSSYTDDVEEVLDAIERGATHVGVGYADYEDVPEGPGRIGGTLITRRTTAVLTAEEFVERNPAKAILHVLRRDGAKAAV